MPGRLRSSFRSGNLAEDLGLLLLKGIVAVAEVTHTEDIGLDAIATLLRLDNDGNLYAEDSFVVQLKADSVTSSVFGKFFFALQKRPEKDDATPSASSDLSR